MSVWNGRAGKGGKKVLREVKRAEAESRNAAAAPVWTCTEGHRHGNGMQCVRVLDHNGDSSDRFTGHRSDASRVTS